MADISEALLIGFTVGLSIAACIGLYMERRTR